MAATLYADKLNWESLGYFAHPTPADDPDINRDPDGPLWLQLEQILRQAKAGDFREISRLLDLYPLSESAMFRFVCSRILGDAGTPPCFERIFSELEAEKGQNPGKTLHYCSVLKTWGALQVVPVLLGQFEALHRNRDAEIIPVHLSSLLETEWGPISEVPKADKLVAYRRLVLGLYDELLQQFKSDRTLIFNGKLWGVVPFAKLIVARGSDEAFNHTGPFEFRRRFEASTGIDCSPFFQEKRFQPLTAIAIVEAFLESPAAAKFEDGVRYFFSHRIPD